MAVLYIFLLLAVNSFFSVYTDALTSTRNILTGKIFGNSLGNHNTGNVLSVRQSSLYANPINSDGSKYRGDITEEEAFLWFDEAMVSVSCDR